MTYYHKPDYIKQYGILSTLSASASLYVQFIQLSYLLQLNIRIQQQTHQHRAFVRLCWHHASLVPLSYIFLTRE